MINFKVVLSPYFALLISLMLALLAVLPSDYFYRRNFAEKSLVTFSLPVLTWVAACSICYAFGLYFTGLFFGKKHNKSKTGVLQVEISDYRFRVILICLFAILLNLYGLIQLYKFFGFRGLLSAMVGIGDVDLRLAVYGALKAVNTGWAIAFTVPVASVVFITLIKTKDNILKSLFIILLVIHTALILTTQSKGPIFALVISLVICMQMLRFPRLYISRKDILKSVLISTLLVIVFLTIQYRRNPDILSLDGSYKEISAYTIVSYNRLAYLISDKLQIPNMYMGFWTNRWFWGLPGEQYSNYLLSRAQFDIPYNAFAAWLDTFRAVNSAGLNDKYIWITIYGEVFADYRWFGFIWFFIYGVGSRIAYEDMKRGHLRSYAVYPFVLQCNFGWYSGATIGTRSILFCVLIALYLSLRTVNFPGILRNGQQKQIYVECETGEK